VQEIADYQLDFVPIGTGPSERIGRKITIKSIHLKGEAYMFSSSATSLDEAASTIVRIFIVQDTQCNGSSALATDIWTTAKPSQNQINMENSSRFRVLKKIVLVLKSPFWDAAALKSGAVTMPFEHYMKCDIPLEYSGTTGVVSELRSNHVQVWVSSSENAFTSVIGSSRIRYSDN